MFGSTDRDVTKLLAMSTAAFFSLLYYTSTIFFSSLFFSNIAVKSRDQTSNFFLRQEHLRVIILARYQSRYPRNFKWTIAFVLWHGLYLCHVPY